MSTEATVHSQTEAHHQGHDHSAANRDFFNEIAHKYDDRPHAREAARRIAAAMRTKMAVLFQEDATDMMEYACGTGLVSRELCAYVRSIVGVDISEEMVEQFNLRAGNQGLEPDEMQAFCVELKGNEEELDGREFDLIVCSLSYHHFSSIEDVTRILAFFLKPGGSLLVADIMKSTIEGDIFPGNTDVVTHQRGFSEEEMRRVFEEAGLANVAYMLATSGTLHGKPVDFFLACGVKPT